MKAQKFNITLLVLFLLINSGLVFSQKSEFNKKIEKEYPANEKTLLNITNKFGDIKFTDWDESKVKIEVTITVVEKDEEKANEKLEDVDVVFSNTGDNIIVATEFGKGKAGFFKTAVNKNVEMSVNYEVKLPRYLKLKIDNRYGDVVFNEHHGKSDITVKFGSLTARNLAFDESKPLSNLNVSYGNLIITKTTWVDLYVDFSDVKIETFNGIELSSKYTDLEFGTGNIINGSIQFGDMVTGSIGSLKLNASYTELKIGRLGKNMELISKFGDLKLLALNPGFEKINIDGKYSDIKIIIEPSASFTVVAHVSYGDISTPKDFNIQVSEETTSEAVNAKIGKNPVSIINIESSFGDVKFEY